MEINLNLEASPNFPKLLLLAQGFFHTDQDLLNRIKQHDTTAFTLLYQRYWENLFVTAVKVTRSKEDARDIVQEIFLSFWNRRNDLDIMGSLDGYLQTCVHYKAIRYIEKNITRRRYLEVLLETAEINQVPDAETMLKLKDLQQAVSSAVSQMPSRMRQVYQLSRQEQLSHKEIAVMLGISDETVKKHIHHALQYIRSAIDQTTIPYAILLIAFFL